ncbi:MAG: DNA-binding protein [Treponema sp.]|nr:DNA-binding protein [Treponema sp.]
MKKNFALEIVEFPNETLLTRAQVKEILKISYAQLDSHIPDSELPRTRMNGHTFVYRDDLASYIQAHRSDGRMRKASLPGGAA